MEKGTPNETTTDFDGNHKLNVFDNAILTFSCLDYKNQEEYKKVVIQLL